MLPSVAIDDLKMLDELKLELGSNYFICTILQSQDKLDEHSKDILEDMERVSSMQRRYCNPQTQVTVSQKVQAAYSAENFLW